MKVIVTWPSGKNLENQVIREHRVRHPSLKRSYSCGCVQSPEESWELVGEVEEAASACWSLRKARYSDWRSKSRQPATAGPKCRRHGHHEGLDCPDGLDSRKLSRRRTFSVLPFFHVHVWGWGCICVCTYIFACENTHVCGYTCMQRSSAHVRNHPWSLFHLILWGRASQSKPELMDMASPASQLAVGSPSPPSWAMSTTQARRLWVHASTSSIHVGPGDLTHL